MLFPSQADQETDSDSEKEEGSTITIRKLKSNKKMLISKNQRLCGVLDKIDTVIVEGTKMTHTQVTKKHLRYIDVSPWYYKWMNGRMVGFGISGWR